MKELRYQRDAVEELAGKVVKLLSLQGDRHKLVFKAPTGAGKTVMASDMLVWLNNELATNSELPFHEVAYIWIAPNKLHEQSYFKMRNRFTETNELQPVVYDEIDHSAGGYIQPGQILFVNWESINRDNAVMTRDTELSASLYDITRRTREEQGIPIVVIIDEEHMFAGRIANRTEDVLRRIRPKVELRISATPVTDGEEKVTVYRESVIREQMIKEHIIVNPDVNFSTPQASLNQHLIHLALKKRNELAETYKRLGVRINPLLLIQLPNDNSETMTEDDATIREEVEAYLSNVKDIKTANNRLAVWLSGEKKNLQGIEREDSMVDVLLFKQAIALGWDCPRAAVLLIFRKLESFTFTAQTVGRILRMPEQKYYEDGSLNVGYVFTNLSREKIEVVKEDMDYIYSYCAYRRDGLTNVSLKSEYFERLATDRNRLGPDFKEHLLKVAEEKWHVKYAQPMLFTLEEVEGTTQTNVSLENQHKKNREAVLHLIVFNVGNIGTEVVKDLVMTGAVGESVVSDTAIYVSSIDELRSAFTKFCANMIGNKYEKVSISTLSLALRESLNDLFGLDDLEAIKVVLAEENNAKFAEVVVDALESYLELLKAKQRARTAKSLKAYDWEVPPSRSYPEDTHKVREEVKNHALTPFVELKNASDPEKRFTEFLEKHTTHIDWWYKNGDSGKEHFSISYDKEDGTKSLFYVDFIIRMRDGRIFLFDTKSKGSDTDAPQKHNALLDYMALPENRNRRLAGGVLIWDGYNWKYSTSKIKNTDDTTNWISFYPDSLQ